LWKKAYNQGAINKQQKDKNDEEYSQLLSKAVLSEYNKTILSSFLEQFLEHVEYCNERWATEVEWADSSIVKYEKIDIKKDYKKIEEKVNNNIKSAIENDLRKCLDFIDNPEVYVNLGQEMQEGKVFWCLYIRVSYKYKY